MLLLIPPTAFNTDTPPLWHWVQFNDGLNINAHGHHAAPGTWPSDTERVLVVPAPQLSWHPVVLPKVNPARLPAVLVGLLEERLLDDPEQLHFALEPGAQPGATAPVWVAVCDKAWLQQSLQALEQLQCPVSRIVPAVTPQNTPQLNVYADALGAGGPVCWQMSGPQGVVALPWQPDMAQSTPQPLAALLQALAPWAPAPDAHHSGWPDDLAAFADSASMAHAEHACPTLRWQLESAANGWLRAARSDWNLAQFDFKLSAPARRRQWVQRQLRQLWQAPAWRPMRWGLASLAVVQLVGLNVSAWQERRALRAQQYAVQHTLTQTFPHITLVLDAPRQMQRELHRLRQRQGDTTGQDLESLLQALGHSQQAGAWRYDQLHFNPESTTLSGVQLPPASTAAVQARLAQYGWRAQLQGTDMRLFPIGATP